MKKINLKKLVCLAISSIGLMGLGNAFAAGTASGTSISNTATLNYTVGGVAQTAIPSNTATFLVNNKASLNIVEATGSYTSVVPGATTQVTKFTVTNTGNSTQDILLSGTATGLSGTLFGKTDNFDATSCSTFVDGNANGTYEPASDTATYIDELAADASKTVFVVCSIPSTQVNGDFSIVSLTGTLATGGAPGTQGTALVQTTGANNNSTVGIVFADGAGSDDSARDGKFSARSGYLVVSSSVTMVKTATAWCDPLNGGTNPHMIPGGFVQYSLVISNAAGAGAAANLNTITDNLVSQLSFDPDLVAASGSCVTPTNASGKGFQLSCTNGTRACKAAPQYFTTAADTDGAQFVSPTVTLDFSKLLPVEAGYTAGEIKPGESVTVIFNAKIN